MYHDVKFSSYLYYIEYEDWIFSPSIEKDVFVELML